MSNDLSTPREALVKLMGQLRPALSNLDYIPALKHICFSDTRAIAYNDVSAISVTTVFTEGIDDLEICIPGELLIKALGSFNAEKVLLQPNEKDGTMLIISGRSKIKLPTMPVKDFPLSIPEGTSKTPVLHLNGEILDGIQLALISVGNDPTHPATMGVTLDSESGKAVLFSTDNATITRVLTKAKIVLPGDAPVILPTFFCEQLIALKRAYPDTTIELELHNGALVAYYFDDDIEVATLFSKTLNDIQPLDFPTIVAKHCKLDGIGSQLCKIPDALDAAFGRALLVLGAEQDKTTKITLDGNYIRMLSTSTAGEASDSVSWADGSPESQEPFWVDPGLVARACKAGTHLGFFNRVMIVANEGASFLHLIAHCTKG